MKILVIGGGASAERKISLKSSRSIYDAIRNLNHDVDFLDWNGDTTEISKKCINYDLVFPILHGPGGEDGTVQKILEENNVAFVGTKSDASKVCIDKFMSREVCKQNNILVPRGEVLNYQDYVNSELAKVPHVVKPVSEGSSVDTFIVNNTKLSQKDIKNAFDKYSEMLVEEYIEGVEITVPILEGQELSVIEIVPPTDGWFDLENKYNGKSHEYCPPQNVEFEIQNRAIKIAKEVHKVLGARHFSRTDLIVRNKEIYVLELNTIPGMTSESLFPRAVKYAGMTMESFAEHLIKLGTS